MGTSVPLGGGTRVVGSHSSLVLQAPDRTSQDRNQFVGFPQVWGDQFWCGEIRRCQKPEPVAGFSRFFECDGELCREIPSTLRDLRFFEVGANRRAGSKNLASQRYRHRSFEQPIETNDVAREGEGP
jgi:hypothetical protein